MNLLGRRKRNTEPAAPERIDLIPGAPESALGRCYCCGTSWKWVYSHSTPYGDEGRGCFPLCEACWTKLTPAERLPYYKRKVASPKQWQTILAAKHGPCRVCCCYPDLTRSMLHLHHVVSRQDHGDDVADNIVPLCEPCHDAITRRVETIARLLLSRLSDAEYAYAVQRGGEDYFERAYGVSYER